MAHDVIKKVNFEIDNSYVNNRYGDNNYLDNSNVELLSETDMGFAENDYDIGCETVSNVDVLTRLFSVNDQYLGATVKEVSSLKSLVASDFIE